MSHCTHCHKILFWQHCLSLEAFPQDISGVGPYHDEVLSVHLCPSLRILVTVYTPFFIFYFTGALFWVLGLPNFLCIRHLSLSCKTIPPIHKHVSLISPSFLAGFLPLYYFLVSNILMRRRNTISAVCHFLAPCHLCPCFCYRIDKNLLLVHMQSSQMNTF